MSVPDVERDRQRQRRVDAAGGRVQRELADRDRHPAGALVAEAEDPLVVGDHDEAHVLERPLAEELGDPVAVRRGDPGLERALRDRRQADAEAPAGLGLRRLRERGGRFARGEQRGRHRRDGEAEHRGALDEAGAVALAGEQVVDNRVVRVRCRRAPRLEAPTGLSIHALFPPNGGRCEVRRAMVRRSWPARHSRPGPGEALSHAPSALSSI